MARTKKNKRIKQMFKEIELSSLLETEKSKKKKSNEEKVSILPNT